MPEGPVRVPIDTLQADQRDRLRVLAAAAALDLRWDGDDAIVVAGEDEAQARLLVAAAGGSGLETAGPAGGAAATEPRGAPAAEPAPSPAMWAVDPTGRHQYRYWSGTTWTAHVADRGVQAADPLTEVVAAGPITPPGADGIVAAARAPQAPSWSTAATDPTSALGRRYGAFFIDVVITFAVFMVAFFPLATKRTVAETLQLPDCRHSSFDSTQVMCDNHVVFTVGHTVYEADLGPTAGITLVFVFLYFGIAQGITGATLGKRLTGIRVVQPDGAPVGVGRSLVRWLVFLVDGPLTLFLCGIITSATSQGHRRLGDMAARTYVVSRHAAGWPVQIP